MAKRKLVQLSILILLGGSLLGATCSEIYTQSGIWYQVQTGDTVARIANRFSIDGKELAEVNHLDASTTLQAGDRIFIPNNRNSYAKAKWGKKNRFASPSDVEVKGGQGQFIWPVDGEISSGYGMRRGRRHDGIDIKVPRGTPIKAATNGEVVYSSRLRGYGNLILVKHENNLFTVYAHNSRNLKKKGEKVTQGEIIARVGTTGRSSGPHLHFEVRKGSNAQDPMFFLPKKGTLVAQKSGK